MTNKQAADVLREIVNGFSEKNTAAQALRFAISILERSELAEVKMDEYTLATPIHQCTRGHRYCVFDGTHWYLIGALPPNIQGRTYLSQDIKHCPDCGKRLPTKDEMRCNDEQ